MRNVLTSIILFLSIFFFAACEKSQKSDTGSRRPNILLIVADDLGYSDIGPFGGEINTPALDELADQGLMLTNFHVLPTCSPTRSVLMSGTDNHVAGMGCMGEIISDKQKGNPGYEGYLNDRVAHLPSILKNGGYRTYMSGKWHLGHERDHRPFARGFDETFALLPGGGSHFADQLPLSPPQVMIYSRNGEVIKSLPDDFYSSRSYTDYLLNWLDRDKNRDEPFFAYLSFTAPHDPLHAPEEYIEKYRGTYDDGYDELRRKRLESLKRLGICDENISMYPATGMLAWEQMSESQKAESARDMEVYAAMIDYMDEQISRVFDWLDKNNQWDNTVILFFSDNGANGAVPTAYPGQTQDFLGSFDNSLENRGLEGSFIEQGPGWATASMSPRRLFKAFTTEGGIASPCIIKFPGSSQQNRGVSPVFTHVSDIMPTLLELAEIDHPGIANIDIPGMMGKSLLPLFDAPNTDIYANEGVGYELHGLCAYIKGDWKILRLPRPFGTGDWELFNLRNDPGEGHDLSADNPEKLSELVSAWEEYSEHVGIIYDPIDMSIVSEKN